MKTIAITLALVFYVTCLHAQNPDIEAEIRKLEQIEVQAVLSRDTTALLKLWDKNFIVNSPENRIVLAGKTPVDRPVLTKPRTSFTRQVEKITIRGTFAFSMGSETVVPAGDQPNSGQIVKRRYTNIWEKQDDGWKLVARHANLICQ
ncbi:MAG: nuclear transport factor 2 family protein [Rhizobacter sp.]|nr:nuclear transport factor 2 family protein [Ferruginibacter sp.]